MRWVVAIVLVAACGEASHDVVVHAPEEAAGFDLVDSWITSDDDLLIAGANLNPSIVLVHSDDAWSALEPPLIEAQTVWATALDDIWVGGNGQPSLIHWDGTGWSSLDTEVSGGSLAGVSDIWGTGVDDVWVSGRRPDSTAGPSVFHWDGEAWTEHQPNPPDGPDDESTYDLGDGCVDGSGDAWVIAEVINGDGWGFGAPLRWTGSTWLEHGIDEDYALRAERISCRNDQVWVTIHDAEANDYGGFGRYVDGTWSTEYLGFNSGSTSVSFEAIAVAPDSTVWVAGSRYAHDPEDPDHALLWRITDDGTEHALDGGPQEGWLRTVAVASDGTVWAAGDDGRIVEVH